MSSRTLYQVLEQTAQTYGNAPALYAPITRNGQRAWKSVSWLEYKRAAEEIAAGLRTLGVRKGEMVALNVNQPECTADTVRLVDVWRTAVPQAVVLPVCCTAATSDGSSGDASPPYPRVIFGHALPPQASLGSVLAAIDRLPSASEDE